MKHTTHQLSSVFVLTNETHHTPAVISLCLDQWNTPHTRCHQSLSWPIKHTTHQLSSVFVLTSKTHHTSWITLWRMIKVYWLYLTWLDLSLHFGSCCLLHICHKFGPRLHLIISQLRTKYSASNCLNHVRRTKSSIKKHVIVCRTVRVQL